MDEKQRKAMFAKAFTARKPFGKWASKPDSTIVTIHLTRIGSGTPRKGEDPVWSSGAYGILNPNSSSYGLPMLSIKRSTALELKNKNKRNFYNVDGGYEGNITLGEYKKLTDLPENIEQQESRVVMQNKKKENKPDDSSSKQKRVVKQSEPEKDFTIVKEIHNQLNATRINGFPFYAYTGIKPTIISETDLSLKPPTNPNKITGINVHFNKGSDEYDVRFQSGKKIDELKGLQWDNLGDVIVRKMGVQ